MWLKIFIVSLVISLSFCRHIPFYRKDYTYFDEFDAFYKLHTDNSGIAWSTAFFSCESEGAQLFYPKAPEEWKIVNNLIEAKNLLDENFTDIYVGIKNEGIDEFITVDGLTTPLPLVNDKELKGDDLCTTMNIANGSLNVELCSILMSPMIYKPYVCKKVEDISCPTIDQGYKYVKETKKCYKVNGLSQTWHEALNTCMMEGGVLANIESEIEAKLLFNLIHDDTYHVGFRKIPPSNQFYTMKGQNIKDTYMKFYDDNEANCGATRKYGNDLYVKKVDCNTLQPFVCEMEITI